MSDDDFRRALSELADDLASEPLANACCRVNAGGYANAIRETLRTHPVTSPAECCDHEAEAMYLSHDLDNVRERLWRLAALAGWQPGNPADNEATAELFLADALKAVPGHVREGHRPDCTIVQDGECECLPPYADCTHPPTGPVTSPAREYVYDHDFAGVAGHPDDDECTHRSDGTNATYCGLPAASHVDDETVARLAADVGYSIVPVASPAECCDHDAEAHNLAHEVDRVRERLWRLAALAGWRPGNPADNDATAELFVTDALRPTVASPAGQDEGAAEVVTLCGSTKFKIEFLAEAQRLTIDGCVVISLGVFGHTDLPEYDWTTDASDLKRRLDCLHFQKIRMADRVHVIDPGGYIGESTAREIEYARSLRKPVTYLSRPAPAVRSDSVSESEWPRGSSERTTTDEEVGDE